LWRRPPGAEPLGYRTLGLGFAEGRPIMNPESTHGFSVLVVEDSAIVRERICDLLNEEPHLQVIGQASDVAEALARFEELRPQAVVLDYRLPDGNGLQVLRHVKQAAPWCVVIMLTNLREDMFGEICRASGADHFFHKATEFERVAEVLGALADAPSRTPSPPVPLCPQARPPK
jgi:DNA-binding NarL/FixJ family response regulator